MELWYRFRTCRSPNAHNCKGTKGNFPSEVRSVFGELQPLVRSLTCSKSVAIVKIWVFFNEFWSQHNVLCRRSVLGSVEASVRSLKERVEV